MAHDLLIKGGTIVDGTGAPRFHGDVAISGSTIVQVGPSLDGARRVIDASDLIVAPGFIDIHTHYDAALFWDPLFTPSSGHGTTSVVTTNCGFGFAPCRLGDEEYLMSLLSTVEDVPLVSIQEGMAWDWTDYPGWMNTLRRQPKGINVGSYIGLSPIRRYVMGEDCRRPATADELDRIAGVAEAGLRAGALGISTSRFLGHFDGEGQPSPSAWADLNELMALARALRRAGHGVFEMTASSGRPGDDFAVESDGWLGVAELAKEAQRPVTWAAVRYSPSDPERWLRILERTRKAWSEGILLYPQVGFRAQVSHINWSKRMAVFSSLPTWREVQNNLQSIDEKVEALANPMVREKLRTEIAGLKTFNGWRYLLVRQAALPHNKRLEGRSISSVAEEKGEDPLTTFLELSIEEQCGTEFDYQSADMDEDAVGRILQYPHVLFETDSSAHVTSLCNQDFSTYLLGHWVRELERLTLEHAVQMMTGRPAAALGIHNRGLLKPGLKADVVVFDPRTVGSLGQELVDDLPGQQPRLVRRATGIESVIVNGQVLLTGSSYSGALPGELIVGSAH